MLRASLPYNENFWDGRDLVVNLHILTIRRCSWQELKGVRSLFSIGVGDGTPMTLQRMMHNYYELLKQCSGTTWISVKQWWWIFPTQ